MVANCDVVALHFFIYNQLLWRNADVPVSGGFTKKTPVKFFFFFTLLTLLHLKPTNDHYVHISE